jgi:hypothetical protein
VLLLESVPDEKQIDDLLRRLQVGIPTNLLDLLALPVALDRGAYLALGLSKPSSSCPSAT